jgi:hypothetical protein
MKTLLLRALLILALGVAVLGAVAMLGGAKAESAGILTFEVACWPSPAGEARLAERGLELSRAMPSATGALWEFWVGPDGWQITAMMPVGPGQVVRCFMASGVLAGAPS